MADVRDLRDRACRLLMLAKQTVDPEIRLVLLDLAIKHAEMAAPAAPGKPDDLRGVRLSRRGASAEHTNAKKSAPLGNDAQGAE